MTRAIPSRRWPGRTLLGCLLLSSAARAQDDNRLDFRLDPIGTNDASNEAGSGGVNRPAVPDFVTNSANLYITGNVTGGRAFQAYSPVADPYRFSGRLGSSSLDAFRRDSISVADVLAGRTSDTTTPYYSRQRTTTSWGTLSAGFDQVGTWRGESIYTLPYNVPRYTLPRFGAPYAPEMSLPTPTTFLGPQPQTPVDADSSLFYQPLSAAYAPATLAAPWFGLTVQQLGLEPLAQQLAPGWGPTAAYLAEETPVDVVAYPDSIDLISRAAPLEAFPDESADSAMGGTVPTEAETGMEGEAAPPGWAPSSSVETPPAPGYDVPMLSPFGADLYDDLLNVYEFAQAVEQHADEIRAAAQVAPAVAERYERDLSVVRQMLDAPIKTFAGTADTPVHNLIRQAEDMMQAQQYYQAKGLYERALIFDRSNPLALLGAGHAMLAAGEYYGAAMTISRAVELFNGIAYFRFDLRDFITEPDLLEKRRADLEERLDNHDDVRLRFLLGYAEYYSDLAKYGLPNLGLAAKQAPEHSGMTRLYELLSRKDSLQE